MAALNFEHAWGDGVAVMRYFNDVAKEVISQPRIHPDSQIPNIDASQFVQKLGKLNAFLDHASDRQEKIFNTQVHSCRIIIVYAN